LIDIYSYSFEAVRKLNQLGFKVIVITNQSGIGRGFIREAELLHIHQRMQRDFLAQKARIEAFYYCPHYRFSADPRYRRDCSCRKPLPGLGFRAAHDWNLDLGRSYMIGDKVEDIQFGLNIGALPILVLTGYGEKSRLTLQSRGITPVFIARHLLEAVSWIEQREQKPLPGQK
jgi:D-glycero-D-manno-heptose 1,7-bisphosphate phosphatase